MSRPRPLTLALVTLLGAVLAWACAGSWYETSVLEVGDATFRRPLESVWKDDVQAILGPAPQPIAIADSVTVFEGVVVLLDRELARRGEPRRDVLVRSAAMHLCFLGFGEHGLIFRDQQGNWRFRQLDRPEDGPGLPSGVPVGAREVTRPHLLVGETTLPKLLRELPEEFRFYIRSLSLGRTDALALCEALLHLPAEQRRNLTVLATYRHARLRMLLEADEEEAGAEARLAEVRRELERVRQLVAEGHPSVGRLELAAEGWLARTYLYGSLSGDEHAPDNPRADVARALRTYIALRRSGDATAELSLQQGLTEMLDAGDFRPLAGDPLLRRLTTAYLCSARWLRRDGEQPVDQLLVLIPKWLAALRAARVDFGEDAVRLAALQYRIGQWEATAATLKHAPAGDATAQLLAARLRLRTGDVAAAQEILRPLAERPIVLPKPGPAGEDEFRGPPYYHFHALDFQDDPFGPFVAAEDWSSKAFLASPQDAYILDFARPFGAISRARAELAALELSQGRFVAAMNRFYGEGLVYDGDYIAECILTTTELKAAVDAAWVVKPKGLKGSSVHDYGMTTPEHVRALLARRLFRDGRLTEAVPYLPEEYARSLQAYIALLRVAQDPQQPPRARADAYWRAALNLRTYGEDYLYCSYGLEWTSVDDRHWFDPRSLPRARLEPILDEPDHTIAPPGPEEIKRVGAWAERHLDHPDHASRDASYAAFRLALAAAKLLPDDDLAGEQILQWAGNLLKYRDPPAAQPAYRELATRFRGTVLGAEARRRHWFAKAAIEADPEWVLRLSKIR